MERFPDSTMEDRDILLGSYIFLRFYSPAIITPEFYGILTNANTLSLRVRRNLLHVCIHGPVNWISRDLMLTLSITDCQGAAKLSQPMPFR